MPEVKKKESVVRSPLVPIWLAKASVVTGLLVVFGTGLLFLVTEVMVPMIRSFGAPPEGRSVERTSIDRFRDGSGSGSGDLSSSSGEEALFPLGDFLVNPAGSEARRFIKVNVSLKLADTSHREPLEARGPEVKDVIIRELTSRSVAQLTDPIGKEEMRAAMIAELNRLVADGAISNLYFTEYVVQ